MNEETAKPEVSHSWGSPAENIPKKPDIDLEALGEGAEGPPGSPPPPLQDQQPPKPKKPISKEEQAIRDVILDVTLTEEEKAKEIYKIKFKNQKVKPHRAAKPDGEGRYVFPGLDGVPYRNRSGIPPELRDKDANRIRPRIVNDAHVRIFDLAKSQDLRDYEAVMQKCARDIATISHEDIRYSDEKGTYTCFLRWTEKFLEDQNGY